MTATTWTNLLARTHRNCSACTNCPHTPHTADSPAAGRRRRWLPVVSSTVWALGFTSLLTDVSSEMVASVLPMYLVVQLGLTPLVFGVIDGLYQGVAALARLAAGILADRWRRYKEVASVGYGLSAICRIALVLSGGAWMTIAGVVSVDRIGKGIRTAPRDALISLRSPCRDLATAFGVHRALDALGAMLGPMAAFLVLAAMPGAFDVLFMASFGVAVIGCGVIAIFVDGSPSRRGLDVRPAATSRTRALLADRGLLALMAAASLLSLATMSDAFIFLSLQRRMQLAASAFPLLYVMTSLATALMSVPMGRLADRLGRNRVVLAGYGLLAAVYGTLFIHTTSVLLLVGAIALLGAYYAATDGVLTAIAAARLAPAESGSGLALLATGTNVARLGASIGFGLLWTRIGVERATAVYLVALLAAIVSAGVLLRRADRHASHRPVDTLALAG